MDGLYYISVNDQNDKRIDDAAVNISAPIAARRCAPSPDPEFQPVYTLVAPIGKHRIEVLVQRNGRQIKDSKDLQFEIMSKHHIFKLNIA